MWPPTPARASCANPSGTAGRAPFLVPSGRFFIDIAGECRYIHLYVQHVKHTTLKGGISHEKPPFCCGPVRRRTGLRAQYNRLRQSVRRSASYAGLGNRHRQAGDVARDRLATRPGPAQHTHKTDRDTLLVKARTARGLTKCDLPAGWRMRPDGVRVRTARHRPDVHGRPGERV